MASQVNSTKYAKKNVYQSFSNSSKDWRGKTPQDILWITLILTLKPDKDITKKMYRPISLMNIDAKILKKIIANQL